MSLRRSLEVQLVSVNYTGALKGASIASVEPGLYFRFVNGIALYLMLSCDEYVNVRTGLTYGVNTCLNRNEARVYVPTRVTFTVEGAGV
jgi:hypothetical protein